MAIGICYPVDLKLTEAFLVFLSVFSLLEGLLVGCSKILLHCIVETGDLGSCLESFAI